MEPGEQKPVGVLRAPASFLVAKEEGSTELPVYPQMGAWGLPLKMGLPLRQ
jgi:hypothetical protein